SLNDSITAMSHQSCVRWPKTTPIVFTYWVRCLHGTNPFTQISPLVGTRMPVNILMLVDFPAPLGPMYPTVSPRSIEKLTWSTAARVRYSRTKRFWIEPHTPSRRLKVRNSLHSWLTYIRESELMNLWGF